MNAPASRRPFARQETFAADCGSSQPWLATQLASTPVECEGFRVQGLVVWG